MEKPYNKYYNPEVQVKATEKYNSKNYQIPGNKEICRLQISGQLHNNRNKKDKNNWSIWNLHKSI